MFGWSNRLHWRLGWRNSWFAGDGAGGIYSIDRVEGGPDEWVISHLTGPVDDRTSRAVPWPDQRRGLRPAKRACRLDADARRG